MSSFSTSKCVGHISANSWGLEAISKHHPTAPLPASPSNRTAALEAASSHVALSPEKCLPVWARERRGNEHTSLLLPPLQSSRRDRGTLVPSVVKSAGEMGRELPAIPPSSPSLRVAAPLAPSESSLPTSPHWETQAQGTPATSRMSPWAVVLH